ncbi:uncharacterized protein LOC120078409 [Benincasa hispida]|uniref:uncharacterized protein LOC120078409 n=1 Tax=Benincasa hispida TaxID=102211 RepID=UPI0018FFC86C|nr:uncharacterized protein LOC120078409 [Benincasa hispida]
MFGFLFGWRKASKCKKLIRTALCRLQMLKKKRYSIVKQLREDLFELVNNGYQQIAFRRVEQLIQDEILMEAYDLIENFCEFILVKFSHIKKHKYFMVFRTCPDDIIEAISSLIFASARCGDFPELKSVRKLFEKRFGRSFAVAAVELCPGNLVNSQIKEKLLLKPVSDHEKQRFINDIARDCFYPSILALEYSPDWHQKQVHDNEDETNGEGKEEPEKLEKVVISLNSSRDNNRDVVDARCHSTSSSSLVCQSSPNEREDVGLDRENDASSPEILPFCDESIVYLDNIVELSDLSMEYGDSLDQRFFKFKSLVTSMGENVRDGNDQSLIEKHDDSNTKLVSGRSNQIIIGSPKELRIVSMCREQENHSLNNTKKKFMKCCCLSCHSLSSELQNYCLEQPCYVYSECRTDDYVVRSSAVKHTDYDLSSKDSWNEDSNEEIEFDTFSRTKKASNYGNGTVVYDVFVYSHCQPVENKETNAKPEELRTNGKYETSVGFNGIQNKFTKCMKGADKYPSHVHPKLPDYDEIAAKFIALKREYLQKSMKGGN